LIDILKKRFALYFLATFALFSCNENDPADDFPNNIGIKGRINVENEFGQPLYDERNGITVLFETGFRSFTVLADVTGNYVLSSAPVGIYTITISKPGFGKIIDRSVRISTVNPQYQVDNGSQKLPSFIITKLPATNFQNASLDLNSLVNGSDTTYELLVSATMVPGPPPTGQAKGYRVFIGNSATTTSSNYLYQEHFTSTDAEIDLTFEDDILNDIDIESGDVVYVLIYGDSTADVSQLDEADNPTFPNLSVSPSDLVSIVLP